MDQNYLKWRVVGSAFVGSSTGEAAVSQGRKGPLQDSHSHMAMAFHCWVSAEMKC